MKYIRNEQYLLEGIVDWSVMDGAFSKESYRIGDSDGLFELKGRLLLIEVKREGTSIPKGQLIMFSNLQKSGAASSLVLWGLRNAETGLYTFSRAQIRLADEKQTFKTYENINNDDVKRLLGLFETWARKNPAI